MTEYLIYFHQQWVPDRPEEWFAERGALAMAVVAEMRDAGVLVHAGGLVEDGPVYTADHTGGALVISEGRYAETEQVLGGLTIVDVADDEAATHWAGRIAEACGWPQEVRAYGPGSMRG